MPDTPQLETFTAGAETAVDVAQIERQLHELWQLASNASRQAAASAQDPSQRAITRASLFNFVVYCETEKDRDHATETISALTSRYPCRAIVLFARPEEQRSELSASITAHCHLAGGGRKQVCCEQISICASGDSVGQLASAVLPLLESDLPTVVWWQGDFLARPGIFRRLVAVTDKLIYDTSAWESPELFLSALARIEVDHPRFGPGPDGTSLADLSWTRLAFWRRLTAECFDPAPSGTALERIQSVEIAYGCGPGAGLRALLFAGWLAAQLGWTPQVAAAKIRFRCRTDAESTAVGLLSIEFKTEEATICVRKDFGEQTASARVVMADTCALPRKRAFWPTDDVSLLSQELDRLAPDPVYPWALTMAAALVSLLRAR